VSQPLRRSPYFIFVVALLLRLLVIAVGHTYRITPRGDHFQFGWEVGRIARAVATGQGFSNPTDLTTGPTAWMAPVYTYILAGVFKLCGVYSAASAWVILVFNSLCAALTCLAIYRIGSRIYGEGVGRVAAWTWAVFPYLIYFPVRVVYDSCLSALLVSMALLLTLRMADSPPTARKWAGFGLLWGVMLLTNPGLITLLPCCLLWLWRRNPRRIGGPALCILVTALVVAPWTVRNYRAFGKFVFVRDNLPMELSMGNNNESEGFWTREEHPANDRHTMEKFQQAGEIRYMEERGREFREFVSEHPGRFAYFTLKRAMYFWIGPPQLSLVGGYDLQISRHVNFFLEAAFAFAGLWLTLRRRRVQGYLLACFLLMYPLPYYLVSPYPRYKHIIEPEMMLLIVYAFCEARGVEVRWPWKRADEKIPTLSQRTRQGWAIITLYYPTQAKSRLERATRLRLLKNKNIFLRANFLQDLRPYGHADFAKVRFPQQQH
jgi:4-amino-4-deoxy-L-arabinose transferase-like glycosyltransferase